MVINYKFIPASKTSKILGGQNAEITPYQISLQYYAPSKGFWFFSSAKNWTHICGGSIVNEFYIVTAAHCVKDQKVEKLSVIAGIKNLKEANTVTRHLLLDYKIHPDYVMFNSSDIAVCKVNTGFRFGPTVASVSLVATEIGGGQNCKLTGWGYTNAFGVLPPDDLQEGNFTTMTYEECKNDSMPVGPKDLCTKSGFSKGACRVRIFINSQRILIHN